MTLLARLVNLSIPDTVNVNGLISVAATLQNAGDQPWTLDTFFLGTRIPNEKRLSLPNAVRPNENVTFRWNEQASASPGSYTFDWQMVQERVAWFGDHVRGTVQVTQSIDQGLMLPGKRDDPLDLIGSQIFNTGAMPMDGQTRILKKIWRGPPFKIVSLEVWIGALYNNIADINIAIYRLRKDNNEDMLMEAGWDHYSNPTNITRVFKNFSPYYFTLLDNESIIMRYMFNGLGDPNMEKKGQADCVANGVYA
jgi:hypothetical protein